MEAHWPQESARLVIVLEGAAAAMAATEAVATAEVNFISFFCCGMRRGDSVELLGTYFKKRLFKRRVSDSYNRSDDVNGKCKGESVADQ